MTPTALRDPGSSSQPPLAWELRQVFQWGWGKRLQCEEGFAHGSEEMGVPCARDHLSKVTEAWRPRDGPPGERVGAKDGAPEKLDPVVRSSELTGSKVIWGGYQEDLGLSTFSHSLDLKY